MTDVRAAYHSLLGKAGEGNTSLPLWMHLEDTVYVMKYLCEKRVPDSVVRAADLDRDSFFQVSCFLAAVHDIGKCTPLFAAKIKASAPGDLKGRYETICHKGVSVPSLSEFPKGQALPHALAGELLLRKFNCRDGVCSIVGAHHGKPSDNGMISKPDAKVSAYQFSYYANQHELWDEMQKWLLKEALENSGYGSISELPELSNCAQMLLTGLLIQADWIASNQIYFPLLSEDEEGTGIMYPNRFRSAVEKMVLPELWNSGAEESIYKKHFEECFGFLPNPVQNAAVTTAWAGSAGGMLIIEAQMGVGKTEAALAAAEVLASKNNCGGIFFGLPTQATSNGIFPRITSWAERVSDENVHTIRLVHGMAELNEDYRAFKGRSEVEEDNENKDEKLMVHSWFSGRKQALLADFVVGTVDTALMAALKQKHVMLRHLGLCGKVVIIDECHAYDAYMSRFLLCMLQWLGAYHVPVVLLSATLPREKKKQMIQAYQKPDSSVKSVKIDLPENNGYPLVTWVDPGQIIEKSIEYASARKTITTMWMAEDKVADALNKYLSDGGCAGVIVNTVKRAQEIAEKLRTELPGKKVYVYHSQFLAQERIRRENELMSLIGKDSSYEQRNNIIIVGTQVLEQSLDIDFDYLITDLCPMDLLLQRIGRLHRHNRVRPKSVEQPMCTIFGTGNEYNKGSLKIYGEWLLKQTEKYLPEKIQIPDDIPKLVNDVYAEPDREITDDSSWKEFKNRIEIKEGKAENWCLGRPRKSRRETGNSIVGMLEYFIQNDQKAEAKVRDGEASIDVLVMCRKEEDHVGFLPWIDDSLLRCDTAPSDEEARKIALQRLRLPVAFGIGEELDKVIDSLEQENRQLFSIWQESPWLRGELILLLDKAGERDLGDYHIFYEKENGLRYERKVSDGGKGI